MSESRLNEILSTLANNYDLKTNYDPLEWAKEKVDLYNNSVGNLNEIDGYNCDVCKNKGFKAKLDENGNEVYEFCKCYKIRETLNRARRSGLGNILSDFTFDKFIATEDWQKTIKAKAQEFCRNDNAKWFFIGGQVGSGKSHICTAIVGHYIKAGYESAYMMWCEESKKLKALVTDYDEYRKHIKRYKDSPVLYIDDFLKTKAGESPTQADINLAFEIINHRLFSNDKITIISSEKTLNDILEYDEATMSRVYKESGEYRFNISKDIKKNYRLRDSQ